MRERTHTHAHARTRARTNLTRTRTCVHTHIYANTLAQVREHMAALGFSSFHELVGRADLLEPRPQATWKKQSLDFSQLLTPAWKLMRSSQDVTQVTAGRDATSDEAAGRQQPVQHNGKALVSRSLDARILRKLNDEWKQTEKTSPSTIHDFVIDNTDRSVGALISNEVTKYLGRATLPEDAIHIRFTGHAGQSFGAFPCPK